MESEFRSNRSSSGAKFSHENSEPLLGFRERERERKGEVGDAFSTSGVQE